MNLIYAFLTTTEPTLLETYWLFGKKISVVGAEMITALLLDLLCLLCEEGWVVTIREQEEWVSFESEKMNFSLNRVKF